MSCAQRNCTDDDLATWAVGHIQVNLCTPHGLAISNDCDVRKLAKERVKKQRQLEILVEALKGPEADVDRAMGLLDDLIDVEDRLRALVNSYLGASAAALC